MTTDTERLDQANACHDDDPLGGCAVAHGDGGVGHHLGAGGRTGAEAREEAN